MKRIFTGLAIAASLAMTNFAAQAVPINITGSPPPVNPPAGVLGGFNVFVNSSPVGGFTVTTSGAASCSDPVAILGGCSFDTGPIVSGAVVISPNLALSNQIAVFFKPDGTTIADIFLIGCDDSAPRNASGICPGLADFSLIVPNPATGFISYSALLAGLPSFGLSVGFTGTLLNGPATVFGIGQYLTVSGANADQHVGANLVLANSVPEPVTLSLFGAGLAGAVAMRRKNKKK